MGFNPAAQSADPSAAFASQANNSAAMAGMYNYPAGMNMPNQESSIPQISSEPPNITTPASLQTYFNGGADCTDIYDQLGYTAEEMAALQNAWFAAAQQAQMTALEQAAHSQMSAELTTPAYKGKQESEDIKEMFKGLNDLESERKD